MESRMRKRLVAGVVAVAALAGGGAAVAAGQFGTGADEQAILEDAAERLGVEPQQLSDALDDAVAARIDEAVAAGRLTEAQGEAMKQRLESEGLHLFGGHRSGPGMHHGPGLETAATYLGLSEEALREALHEGSTLAEIAAEQGKSVAGLKDTMLADATERLDEAVADGRITEEQQQEILSQLPDRIDDVVNGQLPGPRGHHRHGDGAPGDGAADARPAERTEPAAF